MVDDTDLQALETMARNLKHIANTIAPVEAMPGTDAAGGHVASLTEAVMGITAGLFRIADAIDGLANAIETNVHKT